MSIGPVRLNHAVLFVADLPRAERFYTEVFGMVVAAREPRAAAAFLRPPRSGNRHDLGLFGVGPAAPAKRRGGINAAPIGRPVLAAEVRRWAGVRTAGEIVPVRA